jgi:hypothetical protein
MKRRKLLAAAIASLVAASFGVGTSLAADPIAPAAHYTIGDSGTVQQASALSTTVTSKAAARTTAGATASTIAGNDSCTAPACTDGCDACDACDVCDPCCDPNVWFVETEALLWWRKSRSLPPLVTTSLPGTLQPAAGVLDVGTTRVLFGGDNYQDGVSPGGRINFGRWLNSEQNVGVAANFFMLGQEEINFSRAAVGAGDILAIPFNSVAPLGEDALLLNFPGVRANGRVNVQYQNDVLGGDVYLRKLLYADETMRLEGLGGYQFARIDDGLTLNANYDDITGLAITNVDLTDSFSAHNEFHGGVVGVLGRVNRGRWVTTAMAKCGVGNMHQTVDVSGLTLNNGGGGPSVAARGLFAQGSNIGTYTNDTIGIIPEGKLNFGYRYTENWTFGVGYSFIYYNNITTAGSAIDRNVNLTQIPGNGPIIPPIAPNQPTFLNNSDFWVQGLNFSAAFTY